MENQENIQSNPVNLTKTAEEKSSRELKEMPYDTSRVGQAFVILSPRQNAATTNLSEKEFNRNDRERIISVIMQRSGMTRKEVEQMLADPF